MALNKYASVYERFKQNSAPATQQPAQQQSAIVGALGAPDAADGTPQVPVQQAQATSTPRTFNSVYDLYGQNKMNDYSAGAAKQGSAAKPVAAKPVLGQTPSQDPNDIPVQIPEESDDSTVGINPDLPALNPTPSVSKPGTQIDTSKPPEPPKEPTADVPPDSGKSAPSAPKPPSGGGGGFGGGAPRPPSALIPADLYVGGNPPDQPDVPMPEVPWPKGPPVEPPVDPPTSVEDDVVIDPDTGEPLIDPFTGDFVRAGKNDSVGVDPVNFRPDGTVLKGDKPAGPGDISVDLGGDQGGADPYFDPVTGGYYGPGNSFEDNPYVDDPYTDETDPYTEDDEDTGEEEGQDPNDWRTYMGGPQANHGSPVSADWNGSYMEVTFSDGYKRPAII